jgi:hypothetical protein
LLVCSEPPNGQHIRVDIPYFFRPKRLYNEVLILHLCKERRLLNIPTSKTLIHTAREKLHLLLLLSLSLFTLSKSIVYSLKEPRRSLPIIKYTREDNQQQKKIKNYAHKESMKSEKGYVL